LNPDRRKGVPSFFFEGIVICFFFLSPFSSPWKNPPLPKSQIQLPRFFFSLGARQLFRINSLTQCLSHLPPPPVHRLFFFCPSLFPRLFFSSYFPFLFFPFAPSEGRPIGPLPPCLKRKTSVSRIHATEKQLFSLLFFFSKRRFHFFPSPPFWSFCLLIFPKNPFFVHGPPILPCYRCLKGAPSGVIDFLSSWTSLPSFPV